MHTQEVTLTHSARHFLLVLLLRPNGTKPTEPSGTEPFHCNAKKPQCLQNTLGDRNTQTDPGSAEPGLSLVSCLIRETGPAPGPGLGPTAPLFSYRSCAVTACVSCSGNDLVTGFRRRRGSERERTRRAVTSCSLTTTRAGPHHEDRELRVQHFRVQLLQSTVTSEYRTSVSTVLQSTVLQSTAVVGTVLIFP